MKSQDAEIWSSLLIMSGVLTIYCTPLFVAIGRKHRNALPISILNVALGWTVIGWVMALVWAFTEQEERAR